MVMAETMSDKLEQTEADALAQMADMLRRTGELAKVGAWELDLRTNEFIWSSETFRIHEMEPPTPPTMEETFRMFPLEAQPIIHAAVMEAIQNGTAYDLELPRFTAKGRRIWIKAQASVLFENSTAIKLFGAIQDITERKQSELFEQFRSSTLEMLATGQPLRTILEAMILGVEKLLPDSLCSILLLDSSGTHFEVVVAPHLPDFFNAALNGLQIGVGIGSCGTSAFTGERVIIEDIHSHAYWVHFRDLALEAQLHACWSQPFHAASGKVIGTFAIYHRIPHVPEKADIELIEKSARLVSIAVEKHRSEEKIRESEAHFRLLIEDSTYIVWKLNRHSRYIYISPVDEKLRGFCADEVLGTHIFDQLTAESVDLLKSMRSEWRNLHLNSKSDSISLNLQQKCKNGAAIWTEVIIRPERNGENKIIGYHGIARDISQSKKTEEALRIAAIAFESQEGMYITNTTWEVLRINKAFTDILGYSAQEMVGHNLDCLHSNHHDERFFNNMTNSLETAGSWQGEIWDKRKDGQIVPLWLTITTVKDDAQRSTHYVGTFTDISLRKSAEEKIKNLAFYDPLTDLPNRRLLMDRLEQALATCYRHQHKGALLFVDLDNFKTLNDTHGHDKGDLLLQQVAIRLNGCTRTGDTVARLGGDEFVIMLENLSNDPIEAINQAETVGEKIVQSLNQRYKLGLIDHHSTPSIGITLFGETEETIDEPLKRADMAMYQAKAAGRNTIRFFDPKMQEKVTAHVAMEEGLREAIAHDQFVLHYQAQVKNDNELAGVEALVRWCHPDLGTISPTEFIPLAEEAGLILPLGQWVLRTACKQLATWAIQPGFAHLTVAVNVSPRQFYQANFVEQVLEILQTTGANPQRLKLEITESLLISNVEDVIAKMQALKKHGVGFSLDDFGTGYSSLSYLKRLPLDQLKIDQSFVRDILIDQNDAAIAKMVIVLADSLGLNVIAEGVESRAQRDYLAHYGCHYYQGYFYSKPLAIKEFEYFVHNSLLYKI
jgi:diguanylate cyclase (GGDEF)-like protein/PAS domain S-box-containing protein